MLTVFLCLLSCLSSITPPLISPPGSPTTLGFFPSPSSLSSPGGLVRMPGLTYNSNGVKDLINAMQGYQVRDKSLQINPICLITGCYYSSYTCKSRTRVHIPLCRIQVLHIVLLLLWVCIVRHPLFAQRLSNEFILSTLPVLSHYELLLA